MKWTNKIDEIQKFSKQLSIITTIMMNLYMHTNNNFNSFKSTLKKVAIRCEAPSLFLNNAKINVVHSP